MGEPQRIPARGGEEARPPHPSLSQDQLAALRRTLDRAVSRVCPAWLAGQREDIIQEAMLKVMRRIEQADPGQQFNDAYLARVGYCATVDEIRRIRAKREVPLDAAPDAPARSVSPEQAARGAEIRAEIAGCLAGLTSNRRRAVTLHLLGHRIAEVAQLLGIAAKRADNAIYRGLRDLRACLRGKGVSV